MGCGRGKCWDRAAAILTPKVATVAAAMVVVANWTTHSACLASLGIAPTASWGATQRIGGRCRGVELIADTGADAGPQARTEVKKMTIPTHRHRRVAVAVTQLGEDGAPAVRQKNGCYRPARLQGGARGGAREPGVLLALTLPV